MKEEDLSGLHPIKVLVEKDIQISRRKIRPATKKSIRTR